MSEVSNYPRCQDVRGDNIFAFLLAIFVISLFVSISNNINCVIMGILCLYSFVKYSREFNFKAYRLIIAFIIVDIVYWLIGKGFSNTSLNGFVYSTFEFLTGITVCRCVKYLTPRQIKFIFYLFLFVLTYSFFWTVYNLLEDPTFLRELGYAENGSLSIPFYRRGLTYGNGEALAVILPAITAYSLFSRNRMVMVFTMLIVVCGIIIQYVATLATTAFLSSIFCSIVIVSFVYKSKNVKIQIITAAIMVVAISWGIHFISLNENAQLLIKIADMKDSYSSKQATGQVAGRFELYEMSIKAFINNPLLGLGNVPVEFGASTKNAVGMHAALLDYLGLFGIFALLLFGAWKRTIKDCLNILSEEYKKTYILCAWSLFFLLLLKGGTTLGTNFIFSTAIISIIVNQEQNRQKNYE